MAAQVVAAAATIELPKGEWLDVIQALVNNVTAASSAQLKQSSLKVLGYICEEIDPEVLESQSNLILTAVIQGMRNSMVKCPLGSAPARPLRLLRARLVAPCSSALPGWASATGIRLQSRQCHCL